MLSPTINRRPFDALVLQICEIAGHIQPMVPVRSVVERANAPSVLGTTVAVAGRDIRIGCDVRPPTMIDRMALLDTIKRRLGGLLELRTADLPGRYLRCEFVGAEVELYPGDYAVMAFYLTIVLRAVDPARHDDVPKLLALSTARTMCLVGTDTSAPDVWINGGCTNPELVVRDAQGQEVSRTRWSVVLGSNDALYVNGGQHGGVPGAMTRTVASVVQTGDASGLALYRDGALPLLSPEDGTLDGLVGPTVELVASSGTPTGLIRYTRRW